MQMKNALVQFSHLEVDARSENADQRADAVHVNEREAVLVDAQHHLQAAGH